MADVCMPLAYVNTDGSVAEDFYLHLPLNGLPLWVRPFKAFPTWDVVHTRHDSACRLACPRCEYATSFYQFVSPRHAASISILHCRQTKGAARFEERMDNPTKCATKQPQSHLFVCTGMPRDPAICAAQDPHGCPAAAILSPWISKTDGIYAYIGPRVG